MNAYGRWIDVEVDSCCYPQSQARHLRLYCMDSSHLGLHHRAEFHNTPCAPYSTSSKICLVCVCFLVRFDGSFWFMQLSHFWNLLTASVEACWYGVNLYGELPWLLEPACALYLCVS